MARKLLLVTVAFAIVRVATLVAYRDKYYFYGMIASQFAIAEAAYTGHAFAQDAALASAAMDLAKREQRYVSMEEWKGLNGVTLVALSFSTVSMDVTQIDTALSSVSQARSDLGAVQNRLEHAVANLGVYQENLTAAESRIRDVDVAQEMVNFTRLQILSQSGTAMLAQANQGAQNVLSLLRG